MRYVVVGLGNIGTRRRALLGDRCVATVDPLNPAAQYKHLRDVPTASFDAACLAVPTSAKLELCTSLLGAGKHVLVEKPLWFADRAACERLEQLARSQRATCYTAYNHRFEPLLVEMQSWLREQRIGRIYCGRLFYGNGTVGHVKGSWRDEGISVVEDLGSHLLDLIAFVLGPGGDYRPVSLERHETRGYDHALLHCAERGLLLEMTYLSWKNHFAFELYGERGSVHALGLPKWGPAELVLRERVFPSGVPRETRRSLEGPDLTWQREIEHFEHIVADGYLSLENDWWISSVLNRISPP
jgi:predicted dehydrogenase